jgi:hypothetical protein
VKKKLIEILDLNCLTISVNLYDASNVLTLNNKSLKALLVKEFDKIIK